MSLLDLVQKIAERAAITGIALHHFVGQGETIGGDHQRNHHLRTVRRFIATVSVPGFGVLLHRTFEVRVGQLFAGDLAIAGKQTQVRILLLLFIKYEQRLAPRRLRWSLVSPR